ncbi:MAG TPA: hypothetical protein DD417_01615 [Elusimicrobia bacterium]|nr:hypothetical protein [Elusimicrobiota bacterium]
MAWVKRLFGRTTGPDGGVYPDYRDLPDDRLIRLLFTEADQLSSAAAREIVARGRRLVPALSAIIDYGCNWHRQDAGWCATIHAAHLLGASADEAAIQPLMRAMAEADYWEAEILQYALPAIFGRLGPKSLPPLREAARDREAEWSLRDCAMMSMAAVALRHAEHAQEVFSFVASVAADTSEDEDARACAGCILLNCARQEHEALLLSLVPGVAKGWFDADEVRQDVKEPHLHAYLHDWMDFYSSERIARRRKETEAGRLTEEAALQEALGRAWGEDPDVCPDDEPGDAGPSSLRDPWLAREQLSAHSARLIRDKGFETVEEMNAFLKTVDGMMEPPPPANSWEKAQDLMYEAWQEADPRRREEMARSALAICPDCCDAYALLAEETARTVSEAAELYRKAVAAGERALGPDFFRDNAGHFWGLVETRPYMRARAELARCLWSEGDFEAAVGHYHELLRLSPRDGQGIRGVLLACLGDLGRFAEISELLERPEYDDDDGLEWRLMKALAAFVGEGASDRAGGLLRAALDCNKYLPDYLLGRKTSSWTGGGSVRVGDEDEAAACARSFLSVWKRVPNALAWLAISAGEARAAAVGRNAPCPCGSGKKFKKCCLNRAPEGHA